MEPDQVTGLYDEAYAGTYDDRFLLDPWPRTAADFEVDVLRRLLDQDDARWIDVGCGTGWALSQFPGTPRAGLDLSPAMLERARSANPDALFLRTGDFRDDVAEWHGQWSLVSCMWAAFSYLRSMAELDTLVENLVRWTRTGGTIFLPVLDLEDLRGVEVPYEVAPPTWHGSISLTGATWTWVEDHTGKCHEHLLAPHAEHFVRLLEPHFRSIEVLRYPVPQPGATSRKAIVAEGRRESGRGRAVVVRHPLPDGANEPLRERSEPDTELAQLRAAIVETFEQTTRARADVDALAQALFPPPDPDRYDTLGATHDAVGALRGEVAQLHHLLQSLANGTAPSDRRSGAHQALSSTPTISVARELVKRLNPIRRMRRRPVTHRSG